MAALRLYRRTLSDIFFENFLTMDFEEQTALQAESVRPKGVEVVIDNRVEVPSQQAEAASIACRLVLAKLLTPEQQREPVHIIFVERIMNKGVEREHHGEAFPDGKRIAFAMDAPNMRSWQEQFGPIDSMLLLTAHFQGCVSRLILTRKNFSSRQSTKGLSIRSYQCSVMLSLISGPIMQKWPGRR